MVDSYSGNETKGDNYDVLFWESSSPGESIPESSHVSSRSAPGIPLATGCVMNTQSAKAKGRKLQQWVRDTIISACKVKDDDVQSRSMGAAGEDIMLSPNARAKFPYSVECKNQERISIWKAYDQAGTNAGCHEPLLIIKRNNSRALAVVDAQHFINRCSYIKF